MFLYQLIANDKFINYVMLGTKGTKMPRGDKQQIIQYVVYLPSKLEQNKIATFLSLLDSRIEAQIKIIEKYKSLIKGIRYYILEESTHYNYLGNLCDIIKGHQVNLDNLLRTNKKDEIEYYAKAIDTGIMSINEVRTKLNMNKEDGMDIFTLSKFNSIVKNGEIVNTIMNQTVGEHSQEQINNEDMNTSEEN